MPKIFVPYDFSENAANTLLYALKYAEATNSEVVVFHALAISAKIMSAPVTEEKKQEVIRQEEAAKKEELEKEVAEVLVTAGVTADRTVCKVNFGPIVVENVVYAAEDEKADLIIMGTHGASGLKKFLFGSVTSSTIAKSSIPVLAVPDGHQYTEVKNIVYASDLENLDGELARVLSISKPAHAAVEILYFNYGFNRQNEVTATIEKYAGDKVSLVVKKADSSITLLNQIRKQLSEGNPQWVVMFTKERSMWDKLFMGSKTEEMATQLQVPLLSFKKDS